MDLAALTAALERARRTGDRTGLPEAFQQLETEELPTEPGEQRRFRIRGASSESYSVLYAAGDARPPSFPADFPWMPGVQVGVSRHGTRQTVAHWYGVDTKALLEHLLAESLADGWVSPPGGDAPVAPDVELRVLERPGFRRQIIVNTSEEGRMVLMIQMELPA